MGGWTPVSPWKLIDGSGQTATTGVGTAVAITNPMGAETRAFAISLQPTATATAALVRVTNAGTAATAIQGILIKTTDGPLVVGCSPGDRISVFGVAAVTANVCELTH